MSAVVRHPRAAELVERRNLRRKVESAVSRLIAILDELDGDPEAEPWLGSIETMFCPPDQRLWAKSANDDREQDNEHGGDILDGGDDDR